VEESFVSAGHNVSVVLVDRDPASREAIQRQLTPMGVRVVGEAENLAVGVGMVKGHCPDILILELPPRADATLESIQRLKYEMPELGIILTGGDASPQLILRCMRAGAQEILSRPVNPRELGEAVKRMVSRPQRGAVPRKRPGKIVLVFSNKGGVGVTSISTNLAVSFAVNAKKTVALVDLNMQMAEVALHLDLRPKYTLADAVGTGNLDESRLKGLLTRHDSGVHLLSTPEDPIDVEKISPELLIETFILLKSMFDIIVIDAGHNFDSRVLEIMNLADSILVIAGLDVPTVRNTRRSLMLFGQLGFTQEKVRLIVNREQKNSKVRVEDLEETAGCPVFWLLPSDYKALIQAIDAGEPAMIQNPRSKISRAIEEMGRELVRTLGSDEATPMIQPAEEAQESGVRGLKAKMLGGR
jgi:pilus assembly protein CpaE